MAMVTGCVCLTSSSSSSHLLQEHQIVGKSRAQHPQQGDVVSLNRIQGSYPCSSLLVQRSKSLQNGRRGDAGVICQVAVKIGHSSEGKGTNVGSGTKIRVTVPLTVYHVMKLPNLNLEGLEGEVKEHVVEWKGKTISATLPYKVQFVQEVDGKPVKFFAHLRDDEFEVIE